MTKERALVLGGGGALGNAWVIGVVAGLLEAELDVTATADVIIGTSAGATAAAQLTGAAPEQLLADILDAPTQQAPRPSGPANGGARPVTDHMQRTSEIIAASSGLADMRRRLGASALELHAASGGGGVQHWRSTVASRLANHDWPQQELLITAVDARTGEPVSFDRRSGVDLVDAVAASTSSGPPYAIGDDLYIDGGYRRSSENADLAVGYARVLVLSPLGGRSRAPQEWGLHLATQVDELRAGGSRVESVLPDAGALEVFGDNMMDLSRRPAAATAGVAQARAVADQLTAFWR